MPLKRFSRLAGARLYYGRALPEAPGAPGVPFSPEIDARFAEQLQVCFSELNALLAPRYGVLRKIVSGGVGREGDGASLHHRNRAFDLDGLIFDEARLFAGDFPAQPQLYLAVEAMIRTQFGLVLAYDYNAAHQDHLHIDNSRRPRFRRDARSHTLFVQNMLHFVFETPVIRDGVWGPETIAAHRQVRKRLKIGTFADKDNWHRFCRRAAQAAVKRAVDPSA